MRGKDPYATAHLSPGSILLKNYFERGRSLHISAELKSDSFWGAFLNVDSQNAALSFGHFYPHTDGMLTDQGMPDFFNSIDPFLPLRILYSPV